MKKKSENIDNSESKQKELPNIENMPDFQNGILPERLYQYVNIIEGIILSSTEGITVVSLTNILKEYHDVNSIEVKQVILHIQKEWQAKCLELIETYSGWRFQTKPILSRYIQQLNQEKPTKYSRATMEILSIIAYKQPVTRGDIESIRGVTINTNSIKILEERGWIEIIGQREVAGRPNLYGTTPQFLNDLGLLSLGQLPPLQQEELEV
jgi:segregation and condensation protein B